MKVLRLLVLETEEIAVAMEELNESVMKIRCHCRRYLLVLCVFRFFRKYINHFVIDTNDRGRSMKYKIRVVDETNRGVVLALRMAEEQRGCGRRFMELLIERILLEYGEQPIYLSMYTENVSAIRLYENLGFVFIHEYDTNGELIFRKAF